MNTVRVAPWVATRAFRPASGELRAVISNELDHEFLVLEDQSANLWGAIVDSPDSTASDLAIRLNYPQDEVETFLYELVDAHLIITSGQSAEDLIAARVKSPTQIPTAGRYESGGYNEASPGGNNLEAEFEFQDWASERGFLWSASWEVTYRCNESCVHCFNPGASHVDGQRAQRKTNELKAAEWRAMLQEMKEIGVFRLLLTGGEVLLHKEIFDIIGEARTHGFAVTIFTNGTLLDEAKLSRLKLLYPHRVELSLYSPIAENHDAVTHLPGSFDKTIASVKQLVASGITVALKMCVMRETIHDIPTFYQICEGLGCEAMVDMNMSAGLDGARQPLTNLLPDAIDLIRQGFDPKSQLYVGEKGQPHKRQSFMDLKFQFPCGAGHTLLSVTPDGNIFPCVTLPIHVGAVRERGIKEIWKTSNLGFSKNERATVAGDDALSAWQSVTLEGLRFCGDFARCDWCHICPGMSMLESGDESMPSAVTCRNAAARMIAYDLIERGIGEVDPNVLVAIKQQYASETALWEPFSEIRISEDAIRAQLKKRGRVPV